MKILSDFDGVLTDQTEEALRVKELFFESLCKISKESPAFVSKHFEQVEAELKKDPSRHGWTVLGRISAFANEDLFIWNNGMAACMDLFSKNDHSIFKKWLPLIQAHGSPNYDHLVNQCFNKMAEETSSGKLKPMDPQIKELFEFAISRGHEVVVVSNSGTERIVKLFASIGLKTEAHDDQPHAKIRIRGGAKKFVLAENDESFNVGEYKISVSRPQYEKILIEEKPDLVIGDVFSLDLALPLHLSRSGRLSHQLQIVLRERDYTPNWSREFVSKNDRPTRGAVLSDINRLREFF